MVPRNWLAYGSILAVVSVVGLACTPPGGRLRRDDGGVGPGSDGGGGPPRDAGPYGRLSCPGYEVRPGDCEDPVVSEVLRSRDSDSDGLSDYDEVCVHGSDPCRVDSNGDGVSDLIRVAAGLDPAGSEAFDPNDFALILPYFGPREDRTLRFGTDITRADVYFLIDTTGSMSGPIANVRSSLGTLAAEIRARIPDVQLGVGRFDDFPFGGVFGYGAAGDRPYQHVQDITDDVPAVQAGLDTLNLRNGADEPESHVEAIYQTATGAGGDWTYSGSSFSLPSRACPAVPDESGTRIGYPCFRPRALPIVVLVSDATWHNSESGVTYSGINPPPATFDQAAAALSGIGGRFIGVMTGGQRGGPSYEEMARRTGSVDGSGSPLVYRTGSDNRVSDDILVGIETLIGSTPQDVGTRTENVPGNPDEFDATLFIKAITPIEGYRDGIAGAGYTSFDDTTFYGVTPGTTVEFEIDFWNDVREGQEQTQVFRARIFVVGNGVTDLDERDVYIVVPFGDVILF